MKRSELVTEIAKGNPNDYVIAIVWNVEDLCPALATHNVIVEGYEEYKEESGDPTTYRTITMSDANEILNTMDRKHDAGVGINWDTIQSWVDWWVAE